MDLAEQKIKIIITDDHKLFRSGVRMSLENKTDIEIIGEAAQSPSFKCEFGGVEK